MADPKMHHCEFVGHRSTKEFPRSEFRQYQGGLEHVNQRTRHYDTGGVIIPQPVSIPKRVKIPIPGARVPRDDGT